MADEERKVGFFEKHMHTGILTLMLGLLVFVASEYASQDKRIALTEAQLWTSAQDRVSANERIQRLETRTDENMKEIRGLVQRIEDKLDRKADK